MIDVKMTRAEVRSFLKEGEKFMYMSSDKIGRVFGVSVPEGVYMLSYRDEEDEKGNDFLRILACYDQKGVEIEIPDLFVTIEEDEENPNILDQLIEGIDVTRQDLIDLDFDSVWLEEQGIDSAVLWIGGDENEKVFLGSARGEWEYCSPDWNPINLQDLLESLEAWDGAK